MDGPYSQTFKRSLSNNIYVWFFLTVPGWYLRATDTMALWSVKQKSRHHTKGHKRPIAGVRSVSLREDDEAFRGGRGKRDDVWRWPDDLSAEFYGVCWN